MKKFKKEKKKLLRFERKPLKVSTADEDNWTQRPRILGGRTLAPSRTWGSFCRALLRPSSLKKEIQQKPLWKPVSLSWSKATNTDVTSWTEMSQTSRNDRLKRLKLTNGRRHLFTAPNCVKYSFISSETQTHDLRKRSTTPGKFWPWNHQEPSSLWQIFIFIYHSETRTKRVSLNMNQSSIWKTTADKFTQWNTH